MTRRRTISPVADFAASVGAFDSPRVSQLVDAVLQRIADDPESAPLVNGTNVRVLHTIGFDAYPSLMLFYTFDDDTVYPLHVEPCNLALLRP
jgi:hypothetical protein